MLVKAPLKFHVKASPHLDIWTQYFKAQNNFHFAAFPSPANLDKLSINIWLLEPHLINKLPKSLGLYNIFIFFYEKQLPFQKLIHLMSHGVLHLVPAIARKADIEKNIKALINEITENWIILCSDQKNTLAHLDNESALFLYLNQLAKRIAQSDEPVCLFDEDNAEHGLGFILFNILKYKYIPKLEFTTSLHSSPHLDAASSVTPKKFICCKSLDFSNFISIYPQAKSSIIYIKDVNSEDYRQYSEICKKTILLPKLSDFQNCIEIMLGFLSDYLLKKEIYLSKKAQYLLARNSYFFQISDIENLLNKISTSKLNILTENMLMLFLEGGKKNFQYNFSHYFSQVLTSNAIMWKRGTIYDAGKSFLEKSLIKNALDLCNRHKKNTAKILGINRNTLREKNITL